MELIKKDIFVYIVLSILFAITVQQFPFFKGNSLHLIHAIKILNLINYKMIGLPIQPTIYHYLQYLIIS